MKSHSQNLNEHGSKFWAGRAWFDFVKPQERAHVEWHFGKHASGFAAYISFGGGDCDSEMMLHACIPFLFSIYVGINGVYRCKENKAGIAIHNKAFWVYIFDRVMESNSDDPWYRSHHCWNFPWQYDWHSTEILQHKALNVLATAQPVYIEHHGDRKRMGIDSFEQMRQKDVCAESVSEKYPYTYRLKNGEIQNRIATVHVTRMTWKMRWWPLLHFKKVSTSINISFDGEVGEKTGSWKGGCTGCGYEMIGSETPLETLRRMESERKF